MKNKRTVLSELSVLSFFALFLVSCAASESFEGQLFDGKLRPCPESPNCISSEKEGIEHFVEPLTFQGDVEMASKRIKKALLSMGGLIRIEQEGYIWATFTSRVFRFVDDMEFRIVAGKGLIHMRSGSRVGYSDLGVNRRRAEELRKRFGLAVGNSQ